MKKAAETQATSDQKLPLTTSMGQVRLKVRDMQAVYRYYTQGVGLQELPSPDGAIHLGLGNTPILALEQDSTLRHPARTEAGLFHVAVLFASPADLARSLIRGFSLYRDRYVGSGDHLVSQAFYFADPEGNGVELYVDRPRDQWSWSKGEVAMDTLYLDPAAFIREHLTDEEIALEMQKEPAYLGAVGHVHLQVGNVKTAQAFYVDALGFDRTAGLGNSAVFVSAGGYHHHMAMNVWNSLGASPRQNTLGLGQVNLILPGQDSLDALADRLRFQAISTWQEDQGLTFRDPWNNLLRAQV
ncbi:MAG: VOC family protein [Rothia sp. (in: high G+C Gram-positive bacteria)]|nr:VOC family protein [Rothia sp. (in: high G+C Gram-positive bacteria)]